MAWETRRNGRRYRYQSVRVDGRVTKRYLGAGQRAVAADRQVALATDGDQAAVLEHAMDQLEHILAAIVAAALEDAGYYRHHGGEWRKRRPHA
jgi:hypothetical protein